MMTQEPPNGKPDTDDVDPVARLRLQLEELQTYVRQQWAAPTAPSSDSAAWHCSRL